MPSLKNNRRGVDAERFKINDLAVHKEKLKNYSQYYGALHQFICT